MSDAPATPAGTERRETELRVDQLRRVCDPTQLGFDTTESVEPLTRIVGQDRALRALSLGLSMTRDGFNVYASGWPGTGRTSAVTAYLRELAKSKPAPSDWCYVNNFRDPYNPRALCLPPGQGRAFKAAMGRLVGLLKQRLTLAFENDPYIRQRDAISGSFEQQRAAVFAKAAEVAQARGFVLQSTGGGMRLVPLTDGRVMTEEEFNALPEDRRRSIIGSRGTTEAEVGAILRNVHLAETQMREQRVALDKETSLAAVQPPVGELRQQFRLIKGLGAYLDEVQEEVLHNVALFRPPQEDEKPGEVAAQREAGPDPVAAFWRQFEVNLLVDNSSQTSAPVIREFNLSYGYLFGRIERDAEFGALVTDFTMLRPGVVHRANGGYLVMAIERLLANPASWDALRRTLRSGQITIEDTIERSGGVPVRSVRPQAIPARLKVVLVGTPDVYAFLSRVDPDFGELFKIKAEFDIEMERTETNIQAYAGFASALVRRESMRHLNSAAVARLVEHGSVLAGDQERLSTHFASLADLIREANEYADQAGSDVVTVEAMDRAIRERVGRSDLTQQHLSEAILRGSLLIDTAGEAVGQVNGLSVVSTGDYSFGFPSRITAAVGQGRDGVLAVDREADLDGPIHTKGVLILSGYLTQKYAHDKLLNLSANLSFEQSYTEVDGDSASSAELYALLSALAEVPVKQSLAVTGSVNQWGQVQAVGGVNLKIEGFFDLCRARGLDGTQGVIIPAANVPNLMLKEEVLQAVRDGRFHVYAVGNVDQGIRVLTGVEAGELRDGQYADGSIHFRVDGRLRQFSRESPSVPPKPRRDDRRRRARES